MSSEPCVLCASLAGTSKEALLAAEAVPTEENFAFIRVVRFRPPFLSEFRLVCVDSRLLPAP